MSKTDAKKLNLAEIESILSDFGVSVSPEAKVNPIIVARELGLIALKLTAVETSGYFTGEDQGRMIDKGQLVMVVAYGQEAHQAIRRTQ